MSETVSRAKINHLRDLLAKITPPPWGTCDPAHLRTAFCDAAVDALPHLLDALHAAEMQIMELRGAAKSALRTTMRNISEGTLAAGWTSGLEYDLWGFVVNGSGEYGEGFVSDEDVSELGRWSHQAGGWWTVDRFVPIEEWLRMYREHVLKFDKESKP